jgi:hypothetical protein
MSKKLTRVKPHTPASYLMMPHQSMALNHDEFSWVGGWKIQRFRLCSLEHPILESPFQPAVVGIRAKPCMSTLAVWTGPL